MYRLFELPDKNDQAVCAWIKKYYYAYWLTVLYNGHQEIKNTRSFNL